MQGQMRWQVATIVIGGLLVGTLLTWASRELSPGSLWSAMALTVGSAMIATALVSIALDIFWSRQRIRIEQDELQPYLERYKDFAGRLEEFEGRLEAFRVLGLSNCYHSRGEALRRFLTLAESAVGERTPGPRGMDCASCQGPIKIVASSSRGLVGYLDRQGANQPEQDAWRELISNHRDRFRILLTHPAYAHLRRSAEERGPGEIELEVLKTATFLHLTAGMKGDQVCFYRGSPTVFMIQIGNHILINPYPYGKMAMDTLCLEFESDDEQSLIREFARRHFDHVWSFQRHDAKRVDDKPLVQPINSWTDVLDAFSECRLLGESRLRLTAEQVNEMDTFLFHTLSEVRSRSDSPEGLPSPGAFSRYVSDSGIVCREGNQLLNQPPDVEIN